MVRPRMVQKPMEILVIQPFPLTFPPSFFLPFSPLTKLTDYPLSDVS